MGAHWEIHGKIGWQNALGKGVGWWVGWVLKDNRIYTFAINIDIQKESEAKKQIELGKACLASSGYLKNQAMKQPLLGPSYPHDPQKANDRLPAGGQFL